jgi:hypothetical protein
MLIPRLALQRIDTRASQLKMLIHNPEIVSNIFNLSLAFVIVNLVNVKQYITVLSVQLVFSILSLQYLWNSREIQSL